MDSLESREARDFISSLDCENVDERLLFTDSLVTLLETSGKEVGELSVSVESGTLDGRVCYVVTVCSNGVVDNIPVGTNITAHVTPDLTTLEHTQHEYVNIPGKALTKRSVLRYEVEEGQYNLTVTSKEGDKETSTDKILDVDDMDTFISEGANVLLQRAAILNDSPERMTFTVFDPEFELVPVTYTHLDPHTITVQSVKLQTRGMERCVEGEDPAVWTIYFLSDGHMYTRNQEGAPVYMKLKELPPSFLKDEDADWEFPDFGRGSLYWEDDLEMVSAFLDRKEELKEDHVSYMSRHPELKAILGDFLQFLLMRKPADVVEFAAEFFSSYSAATDTHKPAFSHSDHVSRSAIRTE